MTGGMLNFANFWALSEDDTDLVEAPPTSMMVLSIEQELGYKLPSSYVALMQSQNGGLPVNICHRMSARTTWAQDHVAISNFKAIGRTKFWSLCGEFGHKHWVGEWEYPAIGVYFGDCPSAGHDMFCLDYRSCGPTGEPSVVHVDQEWDYKITLVANSFAAFIRGLEPEANFDLDV